MLNFDDKIIYMNLMILFFIPTTNSKMRWSGHGRFSCVSGAGTIFMKPTHPISLISLLFRICPIIRRKDRSRWWMTLLSSNSDVRNIPVLNSDIKNASWKRRFYFIIDPETRQILVCIFSPDAEDELHLYGFRDKIPVGISGGECMVDFAPIDDIIKTVFPEG